MLFGLQNKRKSCFIQLCTLYHYKVRADCSQNVLELVVTEQSGKQFSLENVHSSIISPHASEGKIGRGLEPDDL